MIKYNFNETAIDHYGGDELAGISTGERTLINRLNKLSEKYPDEIRVVAENQEGVYYKVPWKWISIRPPRKINMSDERRAELADRLRAYRNQD